MRIIRVEPEPEPEPEAAVEPEPEPEPVVEPVLEEVVVPAPEVAPEPAALDVGAVDALFARLKAERAARVAEAETVLAEPEPEPVVEPEPEPVPVIVEDVSVHVGGGADREALLARRDRHSRHALRTPSTASSTSPSARRTAAARCSAS